MTTKNIDSMSDEEIAVFIREQICIVENGDIAEAREVAKTFLEVGFIPDQYIGKKNMTYREMMQWYGGQFLSIVNKGSWFAMNSLINCCEKFTDPNTARS